MATCVQPTHASMAFASIYLLTATIATIAPLIYVIQQPVVTTSLIIAMIMMPARLTHVTQGLVMSA